MKFLLTALGTIALSAMSFATPISLVDDFNTNSATQAQSGTNGTISVNTTQLNTPSSTVDRTLFVKKTGITGSDPSNIGALTVLGELSLSTDSNVEGIAGVVYSLHSASDMTALNSFFSIDWTYSDLQTLTGDVTFFVTSSSNTGLSLAGDIINGTLTSVYTQPAANLPLSTYIASLMQMTGTANVANITGFGFYFTNHTLAQDTRWDNFTVATPEPGTYALMGAGLAALAFLRRRK